MIDPFYRKLFKLADKMNTLMDWLEKPPAGIDLSQLEAAATDLWGHYRDAVTAVFGDKVKIVADRFHVMQNLHEAIHATRREAQQQASNEEERKRLKGLRYLLLKKDEKLTDSEKKRLDELKGSHPQLYQLTRLRQQLYHWYEAAYSVQEATKELNRWLDEAEAIAGKSLQAFCQTLRNWQQEIVFFLHRITSGFVEGMNNKIRVIKRIAFGLPSFAHFRARILWACG